MRHLGGRGYYNAPDNQLLIPTQLNPFGPDKSIIPGILSWLQLRDVCTPPAIQRRTNKLRIQ